jgi:DNA-binding CsgD family transcriptional regulator
MTLRESPAPVGRVEILDRIRAGLAGHSGSVVVTGPAGIGKSTVLAAHAAQAAADEQVLRAAAAEVESGLPYLTLVDLLDGVGDQEMAGLPTHLRQALQAALLRGSPPGPAQDQLAVRLAVLELLRILGTRRPVLLVIDDLQWVDQPSADVLRFAARRLQGARVSMLAAERASAGAPARYADLCPPPRLELSLSPLTEYDTADLLRDRFGPVLSLLTIARVHQASGGNPLFAIELGRALVARGGSVGPGDPLPVPERLRALLAERLASLAPEVSAVLLRAAALARPTRALLVDGGDPAAARALDAAVAAGLVQVAPDGALRFSHPLLRELVYAEAAPAARAEAHECLATRVEDSVERARHLALARPYADEDLAARLTDAAGQARRRGAPAVAADLAALAAERTPPGAGAADIRRLAAAEYAYAAGLSADAHRNASAAAQGAADPSVRVRARLLLVDLAGQDQSEVGPLLEAALRDADSDLELLSRVRQMRAWKFAYDGDLDAGVAELRRAQECAERGGSVEQLVNVLALRATMESPLASPEGDELLERAVELAKDLPPSSEVVRVRQTHAVSRLFRGDAVEALRLLEELRAEVDRFGTLPDRAGVLVSVTSANLRVGHCAEALAAGRECMRLILDIEATPGPGLLVGGLAELFGGSPTRAGVLADQAIEASAAAGDADWLKLAHAVRGQVHLFEGDPVSAVASHREAYALERRGGRTDPAMFLWHADFVEALVGAGERAEAAEVLATVRDVADQLGQRVVLLGLSRAEALLVAADGDIRAGVDLLSAALRTWAGHPYPLELARAWFALGGLQRRSHRRSAARGALLEAVSRYRVAEAVPWLGAVQAELGRLDGAHMPGLSETERRIVSLVVGGATNREIARSTYLSVKAVEANLTRLYRRHGVRNRAQLVRALQRSGALPTQRAGG